MLETKVMGNNINGTIIFGYAQVAVLTGYVAREKSENSTLSLQIFNTEKYNERLEEAHNDIQSFLLQFYELQNEFMKVWVVKNEDDRNDLPAEPTNNV